MYLPENMTFTSESLDVLKINNTTYSDFMSSVLEYAETYGQFSSLIMMEEASQLLKDDTNASTNNTANNQNTASNTNNGTDSPGIWNKLKAIGQTLAEIFKKIVAKLKEWTKMLWIKLKEIIGKIQEKLSSIGVEKSLNNIKANPKQYIYNKDYFNSKVSEADFSSPRSDKLNEVYMKALNAYGQAMDDITRKQYKGDLKNYVDDKLNEEIKQVQEAKAKGKDFVSDANTAYFSENLNQALDLVYGLFQSLRDNKYETVCKPFADKVTFITNGIDNNSNNLIREYYKAVQAKNAEEAKNIQANCKNYVNVSNAVVSLAGHFRIQMVQMNISRLKIINTFLALWKLQKNDNDAQNKDNTKEAPRQEEAKAENVDKSTAAP